MFRTAAATVLAVLIATTTLSQDARAKSFLADLWGVATDPLKLGQASTTVASSAQRILIELDQLQARTNYDITQRLEQVRSIIQETMSGTRDLIADAELRIKRLEAAIYQDAMRLLHEAECVPETVLNDQLPRSFATLLNQFQRAEPGVRLFGVRIISAGTNEVTVEDPDKAYLSAETKAFEILRKTVTDKTPAYQIVSTYENLARAARLTRCHYRDQHLALRFTEKINELQRQSLPWFEQVRPAMIHNP